ncbi:MAG: peptide chain release factor N(5)-glutamine methyltransferase [Candidatus Liberibacter ctenarytainae]|uniref:Release factor glutamine methyltransferase n=1 Tax=Candidatus Liberibacter ctenarytainae TaxID=2020335 RepID=A0A937AKC7_9HYPH|nr:peptide chain release factor N(5)-glutamine methyltransferase [Candidatus Liberibacter ctenarytainae]
MSNPLLIEEIPRTVGGCLSLIKRCFSNSGLQELGDPRFFLCGITGLSSSRVVSDPSAILEGKHRLSLKEAIIRRLNREPIHRILGWCDFYNVRLSLSSDTFEPRPETEILVDAILSHFLLCSKKKKTARILDLGTGTGAVCLSLLKSNSSFSGIGVDLCHNAIKIAQKNARDNGLSERFEAFQSDWFASVEGVFDIIVSNPPYISSAEIGRLEPEVKNFDPHIALDGGEDGLSHYRFIADGISRHLKSDGFCGVEIGYDQKTDVIHIFEEKQLFLVNFLKDCGGNDRILLFCR